MGCADQVGDTMNLEWLKDMDADLARLATAQGWTRPDESTTAQELAKELGLSERHSRDRLLTLWRAGKLVRRKVGPTHIYYAREFDDGNGEVSNG